MPDYPVPDWPARISTFAELENFLLAPTTVAIGKCAYEKDFFKHSADIAPDQTAYTTAADRHATFSFFVFGRMQMTIRLTVRTQSELDNPDFFTLESSEELPLGLKDLFAKQLEVLSAPVMEDDYWDDTLQQNPFAEPCTDSDRVTGKGGSVLYVHPKVCAVHLEGITGLIDHEFRRTFPIRNGDWVLVHATLHLRKDPFDEHPRLYIVAARHVRRLCLLSEADVAPITASSATVDVDGVQPSTSPRPSPSSPRGPGAGPSRVNGTESEGEGTAEPPFTQHETAPQEVTPGRVRRSGRLMGSDTKAGTSAGKRPAEENLSNTSPAKKRRSKKKM
ncbi:hypothetical protein C8R47DRAFT_1064864 [Mycena vitilis]|nr:hypothetical protein C8R47DRAFT_1064864 [Mycena vitilis]